MANRFNPLWIALAVMAGYRVLALTGIVAILEWTGAHDLLRGAVIVAALWAMASTTDLQRAGK